MANKNRQPLSDMLKPLLRLLLANGVSYQELVGLLKHYRMWVAADHFGKQGRPTNVFRISRLPGQDRTDVRNPQHTATDCVADKSSPRQYHWYCEIFRLHSGRLGKKVRGIKASTFLLTLAVKATARKKVPERTLKSASWQPMAIRAADPE